jgi:hypothetical protein
MLLFFLWASSPVVVLACVAYRGEGGVGKVIDLLRLAAVCALVISGAAAYQVGFFGSHPDAQSGLLFVFVPLYQWFAVVVVFLLLVVVKHAYHRRRGT